MPLVVLIDQATELPLRKLQFEHRKRRIGERASFDQASNFRLRSRMLDLQARAHPRDHVGHQFGRDRESAMSAASTLQRRAFRTPVTPRGCTSVPPDPTLL